MGTVLKQKMSMLVGLLAAIAMAFVLTPVAAHATPTSPTDVADSTVTINNLIDGDTVEAFLIADADIDASNNLTYTMAANLPSAYDSIDKIKVVASDGNSFHQGSDMQNAASAIGRRSLTPVRLRRPAPPHPAPRPRLRLVAATTLCA